VYLPAILLVAALAVLLFGWVPRLVAAVWSLVAFTFVVAWLGELLELPARVADLSPFSHLPAVPAEAVTAWPLVLLSLGTLVALAGGWLGFQRRDVGAGA
jgi:ABC-2 type transport system permease protein